MKDWQKLLLCAHLYIITGGTVGTGLYVYFDLRSVWWLLGLICGVFSLFYFPTVWLFEQRRKKGNKNWEYKIAERRKMQ